MFPFHFVALTSLLAHVSDFPSLKHPRSHPPPPSSLHDCVCDRAWRLIFLSSPSSSHHFQFQDLKGDKSALFVCESSTPTYVFTLLVLRFCQCHHPQQAFLSNSEASSKQGHSKNVNYYYPPSFTAMPSRNLTVVYQPSTPRRSPRLALLHETTTSNAKPKSTKKFSIQSRTPSVEVLSLRRSDRFSHPKALVNEQKIEVKTSVPSCDSATVKKRKTKEGSVDKGIAVGVGVNRKSPRLNDKVPFQLRRSDRFSDHKVLMNEQKIEVKLSEFPSSNSTRVKKGKTKEGSGDEGTAVGVDVKWKRKSPRFNDKVPSPRRQSARFSDCKFIANEQKNEVKMSKFPSNNSKRVEKGKSKEGSGGEGVVVGVKRNKKHVGDEIVEGWKKEQVEYVVKGKRMGSGDEIAEERMKEPAEAGVKGKRKHGGYEIAEGWTEEQELALRRAYSIVKPNPHFWKNVSKLVPGKSSQDCFDRIHADYSSPSPSPRSRTKRIEDASPPVLKPVKNMVQHEKYIKQLQRRNRKRRTVSAQVGEGKGIQKMDVKAAKVALRSIARDAINKFQQSQAIDDESDEDSDDDIG